MKRFTETCRFDEEWYSEMPPEMKCAYEFIWARADNAGIWSVNRKLAEFQIGKKINWDEFIKTVKGRVIILNEREWMLCGFVEMQCGKLSLDCRPHRIVIDLLRKRGLLTDSLSIDYPKGSLLPFNTITVKGKGKEVQEEGDDLAKEILAHLNSATGCTYRPVETNLQLIRSRLSEKGVEVDGVKKMINRQVKAWTGTEYEEHLTPATLFGKEKFSKYYDRREQPVNPRPEAKLNGTHQKIRSASEVYGQSS